MNLLKKIWHFYYDGFRNLSGTGRKLWVIILLKLFILFVLLRLIFFPDFLGSRFRTDQEKGAYVRDQLIMRD